MRIVLILAVAAVAAGCSEPAEVLAEHFEAMALTAEAHAEDCPQAASQLQSYLDSHRDEMAEAAGQLGESSEVQARRIHVASQRLDKVVEACRASTPEMEAFATSVSKLVLDATGLATDKVNK